MVLARGLAVRWHRRCIGKLDRLRYLNLYHNELSGVCLPFRTPALVPSHAPKSFPSYTRALSCHPVHLLPSPHTLVPSRAPCASFPSYTHALLCSFGIGCTRNLFSVSGDEHTKALVSVTIGAILHTSKLVPRPSAFTVTGDPDRARPHGGTENAVSQQKPVHRVRISSRCLLC